jgi:prepilin-type N-terminal cleavage/methylation domain-containing protein
MKDRGRDRGFTLIELMIVIAIIAVIAAIAIPGMLSSTRAANERNAATSLKTLVSAEADFRSNDRDCNKVKDFWTGDVAGLYGMTSAVLVGNTDAPIKLIDLAVAGADSAPLASGAAGNEYCPVSQFTVQSPKSGHWYYAMANDAPAGGSAYAVDTGGTPVMGAVHNQGKFAFLTYPDVWRSGGKKVFMINETSAMFSREISTSIKSSNLSPPTAPLSAWRDWPTDGTLKSYWSAN